jgi:hypothetical protein
MSEDASSGRWAQAEPTGQALGDMGRHFWGPLSGAEPRASVDVICRS